MTAREKIDRATALVGTILSNMDHSNPIKTIESDLWKLKELLESEEEPSKPVSN